jgi:hypothetical protein
MQHITLDFLPCQASSVPCEQLFSGGGEIVTKQWAQLGADPFKELQSMKFAWRNNIGDLAVWNLFQVEEIDEDMVFVDMLIAEEEQGGLDGWTEDKDEFAS